MSSTSDQKLLGSTLWVSALTLLSRLLGLVRDIIIMQVFGASGLMDAFLVAFKIPNFLRRLFAEGAFSQAFVPVLAEYRARYDHAAVSVLVSRMAGVLLVLLSSLTFVMMVFAPAVVGLFAVGFVSQPDKFATATSLLRLMLPYLLLITMTAFFGSVLQSYGRFIAAAFAPILLNLCMIMGALLLAPYLATPIRALGYAVLVAGILQLGLQLPSLYHAGLLSPPKIDFAHAGVKRILALILPAVFGVSVTQINLLVNTLFASLMPTGSVSWLYAAERMSELPLGLIGIAIGTVILPSLSHDVVKQDQQAFANTLDWALRMVMLVGMPASIALLLISEVLMQTLFVNGAFTEVDAHMSALALKCLAGGVIGFMLIKVLAPAFFAHGDSKSPVKIGMITVASNIVMSGILAGTFYMLGIAPHAALALSATLASWVNAALLYRKLYQQGRLRLTGVWLGFVKQMMVANITMVAAVLGVLHYFPHDASHLVRITVLLGMCLLGAVVYTIAMLAMGFKLAMLKPSRLKP